MIRQQFQVHTLNAAGIAKVKHLAELFSGFLDAIEKIVPPGRELSLVVTKLQEASFFARGGIAADSSDPVDAQ